MTDRDGRPDPDALLARVGGRFKLLFGAAPGAGITFGMLEAAATRRMEGIDVEIGIVETHGRKDTLRLTDGFEAMPLRTFEHRGTALQEFDIDAAMQMRRFLRSALPVHEYRLIEAATMQDH